MTKNSSAVALGRLGGKSRSEAKIKAVRENGKKGGRPRKNPVVQPQKKPNPKPVTPKEHTAFVTSKKGFCYLTIKIGRYNHNIMKIRQYKITGEDKRDMRRLHKDVEFDWKKINAQLAIKREVCRDYRSRRQRRPTRQPREPFLGVIDYGSRTIYANDASLGGSLALLDIMLERERNERHPI